MKGDDRTNAAALLISGERSPVVCGYNRVVAKKESQTILEFRDLLFKQGRPTLGKVHPALVLGQAGCGRTAAFMTDCAPHWAGSLVDWGNRRITVRCGRTNAVEVGNHYLRFFSRLIQGLKATSI
jgi:uncharacterized membrane protein